MDYPPAPSTPPEPAPLDPANSYRDPRAQLEKRRQLLQKGGFTEADSRGQHKEESIGVKKGEEGGSGAAAAAAEGGPQSAWNYFLTRQISFKRHSQGSWILL